MSADIRKIFLGILQGRLGEREQELLLQEIRQDPSLAKHLQEEEGDTFPGGSKRKSAGTDEQVGPRIAELIEEKERALDSYLSRNYDSIGRIESARQILQELIEHFSFPPTQNLGRRSQVVSDLDHTMSGMQADLDKLDSSGSPFASQPADWQNNVQIQGISLNDDGPTSALHNPLLLSDATDSLDHTLSSRQHTLLSAEAADHDPLEDDPTTRGYLSDLANFAAATETKDKTAQSLQSPVLEGDTASPEKDLNPFYKIDHSTGTRQPLEHMTPAPLEHPTPLPASKDPHPAAPPAIEHAVPSFHDYSNHKRWKATLEYYNKQRPSEDLVQGETLVGASMTCRIRLNDPEISGMHARFLFDNQTGCLWVEDLGSTNGTYLVEGMQQNPLTTPSSLAGRNLLLPHPHRVHHGDVLLIGETYITLHIVPS